MITLLMLLRVLGVLGLHGGFGCLSKRHKQIEEEGMS